MDTAHRGIHLISCVCYPEDIILVNIIEQFNIVAFYCTKSMITGMCLHLCIFVLCDLICLEPIVLCILLTFRNPCIFQFYEYKTKLN